jgi:hypothetical protein
MQLSQLKLRAYIFGGGQNENAPRNYVCRKIKTLTVIDLFEGMLGSSTEVRARAPAPAHCSTPKNGGANLSAALRPPNGG